MYHIKEDKMNRIKELAENSLMLMQSIQLTGQQNFYIGFNVITGLQEIIKEIDKEEEKPIVVDNTQKGN